MTPYLPYAGIGSQKTPTHIQAVMRHVGAYLASEGWTLRSGGANGADTAFEDGVKEQQVHPQQLLKMEIYLPWVGFNHNPSQLHPGNIPFSQHEIDVSADFHPAWHRCSSSVRLLHQRNLRQMLGHPSVAGPIVKPSKFVCCWTENGLMKGGTSQALRIANSCDIPIVNLGLATNAKELEALVLEVDRLQNQFKKEAD